MCCCIAIHAIDMMEVTTNTHHVFVPSTYTHYLSYMRSHQTNIFNTHPPSSYPLHTLPDDRLDGYQKKKYVCKLLFIFLLGNDIDFGHQEAVNLLSSVRFSEKQIVSLERGKSVVYHNWAMTPVDKNVSITL